MTTKIILFRGLEDTPGYWAGIGLGAETSGYLDGVTIEGAGAHSWECSEGQESAAVLLEANSELTMINSSIVDSEGWGIYSTFDNVEVNAWSNTYVDNERGDTSVDGTNNDYDYDSDDDWSEDSDSDDWNDSDDDGGGSHDREEWDESDDQDWDDSDHDWNDNDNGWRDSDDDNDWNDSDDDYNDWDR